MYVYMEEAWWAWRQRGVVAGETRVSRGWLAPGRRPALARKVCVVIKREHIDPAAAPPHMSTIITPTN